MTAVVDTGEAIELTFITVPGATVVVNWLDPYLTPVLDSVAVTESPPASGKFPKTFIPTSPNMWTAQFIASGTTSAIEEYHVRARALLGPLPFAAVGDVAAQFGSMTPAQAGLTAHLTRAGSTLLRLRARQAGLDMDADLASGRLTHEAAALAVVNMVLRVLRNPNGLRAETVGPFSRTFDTTAAAGLLVVTDTDLSIVTPPPVVPEGVAGLGVGTIRVVPGMAPPVGWPFRGGWSGRGY
jgi:hypothetical protein